jgi:hypothetical protein
MLEPKTPASTKSDQGYWSGSHSDMFTRHVTADREKKWTEVSQWRGEQRNGGRDTYQCHERRHQETAPIATQGSAVFHAKVVPEGSGTCRSMGLSPRESLEACPARSVDAPGVFIRSLEVHDPRLDEVSLPDQYENNIGNINGLAFYHEIRWHLGNSYTLYIP